MHEKEFVDFVKRERDAWWKEPKATRDDLPKLMKTIASKETSMRSENRWNKMSAQDSQILALVTHVEPLEKSKGNSTTTSDTEQSNNGTKRNRNKYKVPEWKTVVPKSDQPKEKAVDGRTYHWCGKCRDGKGLWALHPEI